MEGKEKFTEELNLASDAISAGKVILYPTDTIWGIGGDATNPEVVKAIFRIKRRDDSKSLLALIDSVESLGRWVSNIPATALRLMESSDRPLTVIYDSPVGVADNLCADDGSLGIRVTSDPFCNALCRRCGKPIISTSANISGMPAPSSFREISPEILVGVDHVVDLRKDDTASRKPSSIIKVRDDESFTIIR